MWSEAYEATPVKRTALFTGIVWKTRFFGEVGTGRGEAFVFELGIHEDGGFVKDDCSWYGGTSWY